MKNYIASIFLLLSISIFAQEQILNEPVSDTLYKPNYPEGVYATKEAFLNKKPVIRKIWPINIGGVKNTVQKAGIHSCFFYGADLEKITDVFAVSYQGHLYFQLKGIFRNCNKNDRNETSNIPNAFTRVIIGGDNYFYTEAPLANAWAQGFAIGGVGGAVGSQWAQSQIHGKGIVWDAKHQEFNIFKDCKDYNEFIYSTYPEGILDCKNKKQNPYMIRKVMEVIK